MVSISASVSKKRNTIYGFTEVDITILRQKMRSYREKTGESLSFTAYVVKCLALAVAEQPCLNSFPKRRKLVLPDDVTISVLVERELNEEKVPEPIGIRETQKKSYRQIHEEIRNAQREEENRLGSFSGMGWIRYIPDCLMRAFFRAASNNIRTSGKAQDIS